MNIRIVLLTATLVIIAAGLLRGQVAKQGFAVNTTVAQGELKGILSTVTGVRHYLGVPFAAPPVGDLRWRAPQPAAPWTGVRSANTFGPRPVQQFVFDDMRFRSEMSEDCLYLNVWTPTGDTAAGLPILLYFHGGGNRAGSGDELRYDGEYLASQGVIVVTANYRLGMFGFLAHPELSAETGKGSGNYGLLDQVAALEWVHANAGAFGGDPDRITIGGESAGAMDCSLLMASPLSRELIGGVFGQSGSAIAGNYQTVPLAEGEAQGEALLEGTSFSSVADLRRATTAELYDLSLAKPNVRYPLVIDGRFLPRHPRKIYEAGDQASVPLLVGWTHTEAAWVPAAASAAAYEAEVRQQYGKRAAEILRLYPSSDHVRSKLDLASDAFIVAATGLWADVHARTGNAPVYRWRFDRIRPPLKGEERPVDPPGAGHATDIEYFFNTLDKSDAYAWTAADRKTAEQMSAALLRFLKTSDPGGAGLDWPAVRAGKRARVMHLNETLEVRVAPAGEGERFRVVAGE